MKTIYKRVIAVLILCVVVITVAHFMQGNAWYEPKETVPDTEDTLKEAPKDDVVETADLIFWYEDESYRTFLEQAVKSYKEETGKVVELQYIDTLDYLDAVYDATMAEGNYPDVYLLSGEELEEAYLYGLAAINTSRDAYETSASKNAVNASVYQNVMYGYPLSYNTCLFVYLNGYFETAPTSIQEIITYSNENEPPENVEFLMEWDVNDAFYNFPFVSNGVKFSQSETSVVEITYNETLYQSDLAFLQEMLESFSVDANTVSEEKIISNLQEKKTLCAILDSDSLAQLNEEEYSIMEMPKLSDSLQSASCGLTDLVMVNDFSKNQETAEEFAKFVTLTMSEQLHALSGHYSVVLSDNANATEQIAYNAYENSILAPCTQDARDFWVKLKETIAVYFD